MNVEDIREYCLSKKAVTENFPFNETTLVFKVCNKIFALIDINNPEIKINLKCNPEYAVELREQYTEIVPGYHMNKRHWNTITCNGKISQQFLFKLIDHSYNLIVEKLPKKDKIILNN